jgi:hypothetical protein
VGILPRLNLAGRDSSSTKNCQDMNDLTITTLELSHLFLIFSDHHQLSIILDNRGTFIHDIPQDTALHWQKYDRSSRAQTKTSRFLSPTGSAGRWS